MGRRQEKRKEIERLKKTATDRNSQECLVKKYYELMSILKRLKKEFTSNFEPQKAKKVDEEQIEVRRAIRDVYKNYSLSSYESNLQASLTQELKKFGFNRQ